MPVGPILPHIFATAGLNTPGAYLDDDYNALQAWIAGRNPTVGPIGSRPAAGNVGAIWVASDVNYTAYVDDGSAWQKINLQGIPRVLTLYVQNFSSPADTAEHDALNYTLPAGTLAVNGEGLEIAAFVGTANNGNTKRFRFYFGATLVLDTGASAWVNQTAVLCATVTRVTGTTQNGSGYWMRGSSAAEGAPNMFFYYSAPGATLSSSISIRVTAQNGTASAADCTVRYAQVRLYPTP